MTRLGLLVLTGLGLVACSSLESAGKRLGETVEPYRVDIVQGNVVTRERLAVLRPGMSRLQVRDILGTPLLASIFHANRWDYVFTLRRQGLAPQSRRVTVFFKDDVLERFEADELPTEAEFAATLNRYPVDPAKIPKLQVSEEKLPPPTKPAAPPAPVAPPASASYPPLEPQ